MKGSGSDVGITATRSALKVLIFSIGQFVVWTQALPYMFGQFDLIEPGQLLATFGAGPLLITYVVSIHLLELAVAVFLSSLVVFGVTGFFLKATTIEALGSGLGTFLLGLLTSLMLVYRLRVIPELVAWPLYIGVFIGMTYLGWRVATLLVSRASKSKEQ